jgi:threonine dehydrogenase-like Zn-dependent dehydrogenase
VIQRIAEEVPIKAVVFYGIGDIRLEDVPEPKIQEPSDAIVRLTASAGKSDA